MTRTAGLIVAVTLLGQSLMAQDRPVVHHYFSKTPHEHVAKWGYTGSTGPAFWSKLDPSYQLASSGKHQSPIDINSKNAPAAELPELKFDYRRERISALNNGHTIQHNESPGSFLHVGDDKFALEQFHVHTPSEHTLDGKHFDLEIHFVHKSKAGDMAVVGVLVQGDEKADLDFPLSYGLPGKPGENVAFEGTKNPSDFLPRSREYFSYSGSFTTPPCTEQVHWIVMQQPIGAHPKFIERFATILKANNRPVQKLNDRVVEKSK
ncbi:MAG: carbonic anhydrase family protein [Planctomycetaceae bacterium]|nr:carbonic anhydrase family protein [Planctomycetaceae bacterium]